MKKFILVLLVLFSVVLFGCEKEKNQNEFDLSYFNNHISASKYVNYEINKTIKQNELLLLEEITTVKKNVDVFDIVKTTKKLAKMESDSQYETKVEESKMKTIEDPINLEFSTYVFSSYEVSEFTLKGNVLDEFSKEVLGIDGISNIAIEINLNQLKKVNDVKVIYIDSESGFNVLIYVKYDY